MRAAGQLQAGDCESGGRDGNAAWLAGSPVVTYATGGEMNGPATRVLLVRGESVRMLLLISDAVSSGSRRARARLRKSTIVFLVGDLEGTARWYRQLGFEARLFPPGFGILRRDDVEIFLQRVDGYRRPADPAARERGAWDVYIETDDVAALNEELTERPDVTVTRRPTPQHYGQIEFDVLDPNGYLLVFAQPTV